MDKNVGTHEVVDHEKIGIAHQSEHRVVTVTVTVTVTVIGKGLGDGLVNIHAEVHRVVDDGFFHASIAFWARKARGIVALL